MIELSVVNLKGVSTDEIVSVLVSDGDNHMADSKIFF
jgi:hypothetical protein